jgi:hypothetical protein
MAYFTQREARSAAQNAVRQTGMTASATLNKSARAVLSEERFDIFLCHSFKDAELVLGAKALLEQLGRSVYVDWVDDPLIDRSKVTAGTAELLRERMQACRSLVYAKSPTSPDSKWMPWELGYFDGLRGSNIAIMPLLEIAGSTYVGQEYLGLYPTIQKLSTNRGDAVPFVTRSNCGRMEWLHVSDLAKEAKEFKALR